MAISNQDEYISGSDLIEQMDSIKEDISWHKQQIVERKLVNKVTERFEEGLKDLEEGLKDLEDQLAPMTELEEDVYSLSLHDVSLISRDEFANFCFRLAVDCGDISENSAVASYVDWGRFADNIEIDYKSVDFDGEEFLYHS